MPELPCLVGFASGSPTCILCFEPTMMFTVPDCPWKLNCGLQYRGITTREPSPKRKERLLRVRPPPCLPSSASLHMSGRGPGDTWKGRGDEASGRAKAKASKSSALSVTPWLTLYLASENAPSGGTNDSTCQRRTPFRATETRLGLCRVERVGRRAGAATRDSPGADVAGGEPSPNAAVAGMSPVPVQMWQGVSPRPYPSRSDCSARTGGTSSHPATE